MAGINLMCIITFCMKDLDFITNRTHYNALKNNMMFCTVTKITYTEDNKER